MIRKYAEIFCWKNVSSFCSAKATHIFSAKNIRVVYIEAAKIVNEMTLNELVKLTMLWTTGPWYIVTEIQFYQLMLATLIQRYDKNHFIFGPVQERETNWNFTGCQVPHFIIVLIPYINVLIPYTNLLNPSWIIKCLFMRNMEPLTIHAF